MKHNPTSEFLFQLIALFVAIGVFAGNVASFEADRIMHPGDWE